MTRPAAALLALCVMAAPAIAQERHCGPLQGVLKYLQDRFGETSIFTGEAKEGVFIRLTRNPTDGSWTVIRTEGEAARIVATGKSSEVDRGL